jgi:YHS domain-containing protein
MIRVALVLILLVFIARTFWRVVDGMLEGLTGRRPGARTPQRSTQMVRDPVCGTFILPGQAVTLADGSRRVYFCSTNCRDKYRTPA